MVTCFLDQYGFCKAVLPGTLRKRGLLLLDDFALDAGEHYLMLLPRNDLPNASKCSRQRTVLSEA